MRLRLLAVLVVLAPLPALAQATPPAASTLPEGAGKALVQKSCVDCHALSVVTAKHASRAEWETLVNQMVSRGAELTDAEVKTVIEYLSKNYGPLDQKPTP